MSKRDHPARVGPPCGRIHRRTFLADVGFGITGLALGSLLHRDGIVRARLNRIAYRRSTTIKENQ